MKKNAWWPLLAAAVLYRRARLGAGQGSRRGAIAALRTAAQKDKRALVASTLNLTDAEAKKFWPIYDKYQRDFDMLTRERNTTLEGLVARDRPMSDLYAKTLATELIDDRRAGNQGAAKDAQRRDARAAAEEGGALPAARVEDPRGAGVRHRRGIPAGPVTRARWYQWEEPDAASGPFTSCPASRAARPVRSLSLPACRAAPGRTRPRRRWARVRRSLRCCAGLIATSIGAGMIATSTAVDPAFADASVNASARPESSFAGSTTIAPMDIAAIATAARPNAARGVEGS